MQKEYQWGSDRLFEKWEKESHEKPANPQDGLAITSAGFAAAVSAAENWGTYVTVHAYTPRAIHIAGEVDVKCLEHGQLIDEDTAKLLADKGVWWCLQPFMDDPAAPSAFPEGSPNRIKQQQMFAGTNAAYQLVKKYKIKTAFGTDNLCSASDAAVQGKQLTRLKKWYTPAKALIIPTSQNAELLTLSGPRNPYPGKL